MCKTKEKKLLGWKERTLNGLITKYKKMRKLYLLSILLDADDAE